MPTVKTLENNTDFFTLPTSGTLLSSNANTIMWTNGGQVQAVAFVQEGDDLVMFVDTNDAGDAANFEIRFAHARFVTGTDEFEALKASGNLASLVIDVLGGNDIIFGNGSAETLLGYAGNDILVGGGGGDELYGSLGINTASYQTSPGPVRASLADAASNTGPHAAGDHYFSIQNLTGSKFDDTLVGDGHANRLTGGPGRDALRGNGAADTFDFNAVKETKVGSARDRILDFNHGQHDRIDLQTIDARTGTGNQAFKFIGRHGFHDQKGELRYIDKGANCIVQGDVNGDGRPDFEIFVHAGSLARGDFVL